MNLPAYPNVCLHGLPGQRRLGAGHLRIADSNAHEELQNGHMLLLGAHFLLLPSLLAGTAVSFGLL